MELTHIDPAGNAVMVDVGEKPATRRTAVAEGFITMSPHCFAAIAAGRAKKGDVLGVAPGGGHHGHQAHGGPDPALPPAEPDEKRRDL